MRSLLSYVRQIRVPRAIRPAVAHTKAFSVRTWRKYRSLKPWQQIGIALLLAVLIIMLLSVLRSGRPDDSASALRTVTVKSLSELSGNGSSVSIVGSVRSVTEANILAQSGGTVRSVSARLGQQVPAGAVIAQLDNASERATVLQAEGAYDAAVAARRIAITQAGGSGRSLEEARTSARNTYRTAFTSTDGALEVQIDQNFFGDPTATGPALLLSVDSDTKNAVSRERAALNLRMRTWRDNLATADSRSPLALLNEAEVTLGEVSAFLTELSRAATMRDSRVTATQLAALSTARSTVEGLLATISSERSSLRASETAAAVGALQTDSRSGEVASADAAVKSALGSLRGAQAQLEKTIIRAPIGGTVNFLPIRVGDYVTAFTHAATVAQNGALEIVAYVSEDDRDLLSIGSEVVVDTDSRGIITSISPALDPVTKQIEVHVAVTGATSIVNGQSVRIALPNAPARTTSLGPTLLPLSAVKLRADERIIFTIGEDSRLVAMQVQIGEVRGDRIEVLTVLPPELRVVEDARGLAEGEKVNVKE